MPVDYQSRAGFVGELSWLDPGAEELSEPFPFRDTMTCQVLARKGDVLIVRTNVIAEDPATGDIFWEAKERMGVDRATREHVPGFGDVNREGYFTFPTHLEKRDYELWMPVALAVVAVALFVAVLNQERVKRETTLLRKGIQPSVGGEKATDPKGFENL